MDTGVLLCGDSISALFAKDVVDELYRAGLHNEILSISSISCLSFMVKKQEELFEQMQGDNKESLLTFIKENMETKPLNENIAVCGTALAYQAPMIFWGGYKQKNMRDSTEQCFDPKEVLLSQIGYPLFGKNADVDGMTICDSTIVPYIPYFPITMSGAKKSLAITFLKNRPKTSYEVAVNQLAIQNAKKSKCWINIQEPDTKDAQVYKKSVCQQVKDRFVDICPLF